MHWNFATFFTDSQPGLVRMSEPQKVSVLDHTLEGEFSQGKPADQRSVQNVSKILYRIAFGCLFIFYHILKIYSWPTHKLKLFKMIKQYLLCFWIPQSTMSFTRFI